MEDGSRETPSPDDVTARALANAPDAQGEMDRTCLPCMGLVKVEAQYSDRWKTPLTGAPVRIEDNERVVSDGVEKTEPLAAHGQQDGDAPTVPLVSMGSTREFEVAQGGATASLVPQGAGDANAGMSDLGIALMSFRDDAMGKLRPYVSEWEARGLLSIPEARARGLVKGVTEWYDGEKDFWGGVSELAVRQYQRAADWYSRQTPFEKNLMLFGGLTGWATVIGSSIGETIVESVQGFFAGVDDLAEYIEVIMSAVRGLASGTVDAMEAALDSLRALPGEVGQLFAQIIDNGQDWIERLILIASETNAFEYVFHILMAVVMNMTPNFWAEMIGIVTGFILPEVIIELIFAAIAALTGGSTAPVIGARLATFVAKLRRLAKGAKSLGVLANIVEAFGKAIRALAKIGKGLHDEIEAMARSAADGIARIRHRVSQYKIEVDPNTLGMNGGNIRIVRKRAKLKDDITDHMTKRDPNVPRKRGIGGAHEKSAFDQALADEGGVVTKRTPHPTLDGVEQVEYQLPALDAQGNPTGQMRTKTFEKTIYDSSKISDADFIRMGTEAADQANAAAAGQLAREWTGTAANGVKFRGYTTDGVVTSFFPEINP
ncbi:MAG: CdiA family toxin C-terminal domain-containing protein [Pseudomonadota bacterium]